MSSCVYRYCRALSLCALSDTVTFTARALIRTPARTAWKRDMCPCEPKRSQLVATPSPTHLAVGSQLPRTLPLVRRIVCSAVQLPNAAHVLPDAELPLAGAHRLCTSRCSRCFSVGARRSIAVDGCGSGGRGGRARARDDGRSGHGLCIATRRSCESFVEACGSAASERLRRQRFQPSTASCNLDSTRAWPREAEQRSSRAHRQSNLVVASSAHVIRRRADAGARRMLVDFAMCSRPPRMAGRLSALEFRETSEVAHRETPSHGTTTARRRAFGALVCVGSVGGAVGSATRLRRVSGCYGARTPGDLDSVGPRLLPRMLRWQGCAGYAGVSLALRDLSFGVAHASFPKGALADESAHQMFQERRLAKHWLMSAML